MKDIYSKGLKNQLRQNIEEVPKLIEKEDKDLMVKVGKYSANYGIRGTVADGPYYQRKTKHLQKVR